MKVKLERLNGPYHFQATNEAGQVVEIDSSVKTGGNGAGPGPMQLVLMGLGGCSGIDIVQILTKARQNVDTFNIELDAERAKDEIPAVFTDIHAHYILTGDLEPEKVRRAIDLSLEKYCSVARMLQKTATISYSFSINGVKYE
jgi:putative redox protein